MSSTDVVLPTYFVSHGGGPWPWIEDRFPGDLSKLRASLEAIPVELGAKPRAVLVISGHWEETTFTVQTHPRPPMYYDYGGFPEFTYHIRYPVPGSPDVAERVQELLRGAGIAVRADVRRGFDHGTFAPLFVMYPDADVPILQLSLTSDYDPAAHLAAGRALAPLRREGVLIVGSGFSYHNLRRFGPDAARASSEFEDWLTRTVVYSTPEQRVEGLLAWDRAPSARDSHPAEDHLIPLMVAVGAAEADPATRIYYENDFMGSVTSASYRLGAVPG
ncbi:DODA-type extradiol aromatic ring-opening family dioxygenase [Nocardia sp. alder85J]|uniref:DODA-type extradiol aromatic ring-opening family dioxygenase n=1 Tax=Nocardia sp. alder85J TaxID=2862949 RepID=UPI001CD2F043|nr:class III extradiol ring-cleavage dioxygenase [Nocardia sp. alder85J]MCX4094323.1 class III extradiol ring-cleavage dioxygenase [Nocardia sp. alder85J]